MGLSPFGDDPPGDRDFAAALHAKAALPLRRKTTSRCATSRFASTSGATTRTRQAIPTHHADLPNDISLPDLWKMRRLLDAAVRAGTLKSRGPVRFWVTEFAWDTSPPDPKGVPEELHARWVAEALYRMWAQGVSLVTWFLIRDQSWARRPFPIRSLLQRRGRDLLRHAEAGADRLPLPVRRLPRAGEALCDVLGQVSCQARARRRRAEDRRQLATRGHAPAEPLRHLCRGVSEQGSFRFPASPSCEREGRGSPVLARCSAGPPGLHMGHLLGRASRTSDAQVNSVRKRVLEEGAQVAEGRPRSDSAATPLSRGCAGCPRGEGIEAWPVRCGADTPPACDNRLRRCS